MRYRKSFCVEPGKRFSLSHVDPDYSSGHAGSKKEMERNRQQLAELQSLLWAEKKHSLLIVLQAMDGGGKDGTIDHVLSAFNPQGATVTGFKAPTAEEAAHDFLWRVHVEAPAKGMIGIFNRSHYEDVLVTRVHGAVSKADTASAVSSSTANIAVAAPPPRTLATTCQIGPGGGPLTPALSPQAGRGSEPLNSPRPACGEREGPALAGG